MLPFFWYLLKVMICSGILFGYYWFFLRNKIFHQYNRFYLLAAMSLSMILPLLKINFWQPASQQNQAIRVLRAVSYGDEYMNNIVITAHKSSWSLEQLYPLVYLLVSFIFLFFMIRTLYLIHTLLKKYPVQRVEEVSFVNTNDDSTPFSFFKYIFWNSSIDIDTTTGRQIFNHEVAHIQEKHTYDKLFVNILLIFCWSNPFFWLYRKELNMIHEFIADKKAVEDSDTSAFAAMILQAAYPKHRFELTNNFFYSPIKRRLLMLTKIDNPKISYIARLMVLPLVVLIFAAFTFKAKTNGHLYNGKKITVVIDAGHGGKDAGAISADGIFEKDLTLALAKKIKELNKNESIDIVLTREDDIYQSPQQKAQITEKGNADLFISIHIGGTAKPNTKTGIEVCVAKDEFENAEKSKGLASTLIQTFENNFPLPVTSYPLQREKGGIWVLQANNIPSVLIEAGYITNEKDVAYLKTESAKETIAKNVLAAIEKFANKNKSSVQPVIKMPVADTVPTIKLDAALSIQGKRPLYILDEKEADSNVIHKLDPNNIFSIDVLKGEMAIAKYGKKGRDGVIIIKTKNSQSLQSGEIIDLEKALIVFNGEIIGKDGKRLDGQYSQLTTKSLTEKRLKRSEAIAKYGADGANGAIEYYSTDAVNITTAFVDTDKMPIFYIGLNNPFTVNVQNIRPEELVVNISEGTISGINGNYTVNVSKIGEVKMTFAKRDGTTIPGEFNIKVERLPDPTNPDFPSQLKEKLLHAQQAKANLDLAERTVEGKRLSDQEIASLKQKIRIEQPNKSKADELAARTDISKNLSDQEIANLKQKTELDQHEKARIQNAEDANKEIVITGRKLQELDLQTEKQKLVLEELSKNNNVIFTKAEQNPEFTGGQAAWANYLYKNLKANTPLDEGWKAGKYTVTVKFIVHTDGTVSGITTENYKGTKTAQHCIDVIKNAPKWQPAVQNGRKVNAYKKQPITFVIEE